MTDATNSTIDFLIVCALIIFDAVTTLLCVFDRGFLIDRREVLMKKTNKELKSLLVGVKNISALRKNELVDLVLEISA